MNKEELIEELSLNYVILRKCCRFCEHFAYRSPKFVQPFEGGKKEYRSGACICTLAPEPSELKVQLDDNCHWKHDEFELSSNLRGLEYEDG